MCLIVTVYNGYTARTRLEHLATCFVDWAVGVDGDGFDGLDAKRFLDFLEVLIMVGRTGDEILTSKAVQAELVYPG
jgi:hypothetical protein